MVGAEVGWNGRWWWGGGGRGLVSFQSNLLYV